MSMRARVLQVIETDICRGEGTPKDPARRVMQYWDFDGHLLAEYDTKYYILDGVNSWRREDEIIPGEVTE